MRRFLAFPLVLFVACAGPGVELTEQAPATLPGEPGGGERARVVRVVDGDTIIVEILEVVPGPGAGNTTPGSEYRLRLTGIDTPESVKPETPVECFGRESSAALSAFVGGEEVFLVKDVEDRDDFDRLLRYVYLGQEMANARLIANGYAFSYTFPPNVRHADLFVQLERDARDSDRGLWAPDTCNGQVLAYAWSVVGDRGQEMEVGSLGDG